MGLKTVLATDDWAGAKALVAFKGVELLGFRSLGCNSVDGYRVQGFRGLVLGSLRFSRFRSRAEGVPGFIHSSFQCWGKVSRRLLPGECILRPYST